MRVPLYLHVAGILAFVCYHVASINAAASRINSNEVEKPLLIDTLKQALKGIYLLIVIIKVSYDSVFLEN
jgi:hypothetical protein